MVLHKISINFILLTKSRVKTGSIAALIVSSFRPQGDISAKSLSTSSFESPKVEK